MLGKSQDWILLEIQEANRWIQPTSARSRRKIPDLVGICPTAKGTFRVFMHCASIPIGKKSFKINRMIFLTTIITELEFLNCSRPSAANEGARNSVYSQF